MNTTYWILAMVAYLACGIVTAAMNIRSDTTGFYGTAKSPSPWTLITIAV